jgi:CubicO group peptidase (beta-lactamase class C family)
MRYAELHASARRLATLGCAVALAAVLAPVAAQPASTGFEELEAAAKAELQAVNAPGAAIAVVKGDRVVYQKGVGIANVETDQAVSAEMLFRVGSVTKMFTTAALVSYAEEGALKVNDPIGKYASGLHGRIAKLTAHQLMSHSAGMRDEAPAFGAHDESALAATVRAWGDDYFFTEPGRVMSYSNPGLTLAGFVLEQVAKKPYADVVDERLFKPLGMTRTTFRPTVAMTWPMAQGHNATGQAAPTVVRPFADNAGYWPAGFMFSNVGDLARFTIAFMNDGVIEGRTVLKPSAVRTLSTGYVDVPSNVEGARYGYGLTTATHRGMRIVEHGGAIDGFGASVRMLPDSKGAVVILVNKSGGSLPKTSERALELLASLQDVKPRPTTPIAMDGGELARYAGVYLNGRQQVELIVRDGKLFFRRAPTEMEVAKTGELWFSMTPPSGGAAQNFALVPGAAGSIAYLHVGSRAFRKSTTPAS